MKHAFIICVHRFPEQFKEIVDLLRSPNHYFFINVDKKVDDTPFREGIADYQNVFYFAEGKERTVVNHAGFSQIVCTLKLLEKAVSMDMDYYHSISGQDFPCVDNKTFDDFFEGCGNRSYMHYDSPEEAKMYSKSYRTRFRRYTAFDMPGRNFYLVNLLVKALNRILCLLPRRPDIENVAVGWSWFSWHKQVVSYVLKYLKDNPEYLKRFKYTGCCDEVIFHTMLNGLEDKLNIDKYNALRFIEWHPHRPSKTLPLVLNESEYTEIIDSKSFFCRKIHPVESEQLKLMLRKHIAQLESQHS